MGLLQKARQFVQRFGAPTKFAAKLVVNAVLPGPIGGLVERVLDCAFETAKDNLNGIANEADLERIEKMFDLLSNDFQGIIAKLVPLENMPDQARQILQIALATEDQCRKAAHELKTLGLELAVMKDVLLQLAGGQRDLLGLARKMYEMQFDYIEEEKAAGVDPRRMAERLDRIEAGMAQMLTGQRETAESIFAGLSRQEPRSGALAVALGAAQQSNRKYVAAQKTLLRAHRLRPGDFQLEQLSRIATQLSQPADTPTGQDREKRFCPVPGKTLDGWLLETGYGRGGFGQVFRASKNGQVRALKILHPELADDPHLESRFKREIAALAALDPHPNLVRIDPDHCFGWAKEWSCWYYVMDLVEGKSLQVYLESQGALTFDHVRYYFTGIIEGLARVHGRGLHHRDIKPANILVRGRSEEGKGRFVLADFGLAGELNAGSRGAGHTPAFAAPEQYRYGSTDTRSDVYSLAATIHYALAFADPAKRYLYKAEFLPESVPNGYRALLDRCLDTDPDKRPADATALLQAWRGIEERERKQREQEAAERQKAIARDEEAARQQEEARRRAEEERKQEAIRLLKEGEAKLAKLHWETLQLTHGSRCADPEGLCREYSISPETAEQIRMETWSRWWQAAEPVRVLEEERERKQRKQWEKEHAARQQKEQEETTLRAEQERKNQQEVRLRCQPPATPAKTNDDEDDDQDDSYKLRCQPPATPAKTSILRIRCPKCQAEIAVHSDWVGLQVRCPKCEDPFAVTDISGTAQPKTSPLVLPPAGASEAARRYEDDQRMLQELIDRRGTSFPTWCQKRFPALRELTENPPLLWALVAAIIVVMLGGAVAIIVKGGIGPVSSMMMLVPVIGYLWFQIDSRAYDAKESHWARTKQDLKAAIAALSGLLGRSIFLLPVGKKVLVFGLLVLPLASILGLGYILFNLFNIVSAAGHSGPVVAVAFSPDGRYILTGSSDRTAILWESSTGTKVRTFARHRATITSVAFSPDGKQVLTGSRDSTLIIWDSATGTQLRTFAGHGATVDCAAFSPDGAQVLTASRRDKTAILWDSATGSQLRTLEGHTDAVISAAYSPDGKQVLTGSGHLDNTAILWESATGTEVRTFKGPPALVLSVAFSPDGKQLLTASWQEAILWDASDGTKVKTFGGDFRYVAFSPNGKLLLMPSRDNTASLWDLATGARVRTFTGHTKSVSAVAFSADGKQVLTGASDNSAILWDSTTGKKLRTFPERSDKDSGEIPDNLNVPLPEKLEEPLQPLSKPLSPQTTGQQKTESRAETFSIEVPAGRTNVTQGKRHDVTVSIDRGNSFKQAVKLTFQAPDGIKVTPAETTVARSDTPRVKVGIEVAPDATVGLKSIIVTGTPETGKATTVKMDIDVKKS